MPHYKDTENKVHFIDDVQFEHFLPAGSVQITEAEAQELQVEAPVVMDAASVIDPVEKLKSFLSSNPDVAKLLK